LKYRSVRF